jgi:hypothetical protein
MSPALLLSLSLTATVVDPRVAVQMILPLLPYGTVVAAAGLYLLVGAVWGAAERALLYPPA